MEVHPPLVVEKTIFVKHSRIPGPVCWLAVQLEKGLGGLFRIVHVAVGNAVPSNDDFSLFSRGGYLLVALPN